MLNFAYYFGKVVIPVLEFIIDIMDFILKISLVY